MASKNQFHVSTICVFFFKQKEDCGVSYKQWDNFI